VHVFKPKGFAGAAAELLMVLDRVPIVLDCDDWEGWGGWNEVQQYPWVIKEFIDWQERHLIKRAQAVSVASRVLLSRAHEVRGTSEGIAYLPNCLSRQQFERMEVVRTQDSQQLRTEVDLPSGPVILYVGHYEAADDVMFFSQAGAAAAVTTGATLAFVGDGDQLGKVQKFFAVRPQIDARFFGVVPYEIYLKLLAASDIAAFPYPDNPVYRAKCSVRIIEFMAMGKAVITTAVGQNREYIEDGVEGRLCAAGDLDEFERLLIELVRDAKTRVRMGQRARQRISNNFLWDQHSYQICEQIYASVSARATASR
jgi:glycosyltransferase involved in cell wall biosynthesis